MKTWEVLTDSRTPFRGPGPALLFLPASDLGRASFIFDLHKAPFLGSHLIDSLSATLLCPRPFSLLGRACPLDSFRLEAPQTPPPPAMAINSKSLNVQLRWGTGRGGKWVVFPQSHVSDVFSFLPSRPQRRRLATVSVHTHPLGRSFHLTCCVKSPPLLAARCREQ